MRISGTEFEIMELLSSLPNIGIPHPSREYIEELQNSGNILKFHGYNMEIIFIDKKA